MNIKNAVLSVLVLAWPGLLMAQYHQVLKDLPKDGKTLLTAEIQKEIDNCAKAGGGVIEFPAGRYLSGPLFLASNLTLLLDSGAVIIADDNRESYLVKGKKVNFINGNNLKGLVIKGKGTIDGNGKSWWEAFIASGKKLDRPRLIYITKSTELLFEDVTLMNSPSFHLVPQDCENVMIRNLKIIAPDESPNTDAIDPSRSRNVTITGCLLDVGDDNVAIKAGRSGGKVAAPCENILIENCTCLHGHGISIGSETTNGVKNVTVRNCTFKGTDNAIRVKSNITLGGPVQNVSYSDIRMEGVKYPILLTFEYKSNVKEDITTDIPSVNGFAITNVKAVNCTYAGKLIGLENSPLKNITLENVEIQSDKGLTMENVSGVTFKNVRITPSKGEHITTRNVTGFETK